MKLGDMVNTDYGKGRIEEAQADETIIVRLDTSELTKLIPDRCLTEGEKTGLYWFYKEELK